MISKQFLTDFKPYLEKADEIWIAVALINEDGLTKLQELLQPNVRQHYLVGIDLPTPPAALIRLKRNCSSNFQAEIFKSDNTFHPKVYMVRKKTEYTAFIGSGNLTNGGMLKNVEMGFIVQDQKQCTNLLNWFNDLFKQSYPLSDENIREYENKFAEIEDANKKIKTVLREISLKKSPKIADTFEGIDFNNRYFKREHHWAFRKELWEDWSTGANNERYKTYQKFYDLHDTIFPQFFKHSISDLHPHKKNEFIVSHYYHVEGYTSKQLNAMWLSYGKSKEEIAKYQELFPIANKKERDSDRDGQSFINHARLQIRIELKEIEIWLLFAKSNGGSAFDRQYFQNQMKLDVFKEMFFRLIKTLPEGYYISLGILRKNCNEFTDAFSLHEFCKKDNKVDHFIIGKDYKISAPDMSEAMLPITLLTEFKRLYPLYEVMRDKRFKK